MEYILFIALVVLIILNIVNSSKSEIRYLTTLIGNLTQEIKALKKEIFLLKSERKTETITDTTGYQPKPEEQVKPVYDSKPTPAPEPPPRVEEPVPFIPTPPPVEKIETPPPPVYDQEVYSLHDPAPVGEPIAAFTEPSYKNEPPPVVEKESWLSKNPDLEKFIGENLINKIGIAVLVLGIAFFVKYAIDKDWINEVGRVSIGLGCGALLTGLAHYLRKNYRSFSSVLAGGGIAVFYFTIAFAFHQYHLLTQTASFVIMVVITAFAIALSVLYDKLELAIIALVGGFITPFLVSTGEGNYVVLFTYLTILNIGLMCLAWFKRWPVINIISLFFTELIFGTWLGNVVLDNKHISFATALLFATIFYIIFLGMNMIYQVRNRAHFRALDFFILMLISCSYYAAGMLILKQWNNGTYYGFFTLGMGVANLALAFFVYKNGRADRNLLFLLIGLTASFITLTIPIQLHGHAITMFWSAEFVLLFWLSVYSGIRLFKYSSALVCILTMVSLLMDWNKELSLSITHVAIIFSDIKGIITNIVAIGAFSAYAILLKKNSDTEYLSGISCKTAAVVMFTVAFALLYITCICSVNLYYRTLTDYTIPNVYHRIITEGLALGIIILLQRNILKANPVLQFGIFLVCFIYYIGSTELITNLRDGVLTGRYPWGNMYFSWIASVLFGVLIYKAIQTIRNNPDTFTATTALSILMSLLIITFLSIELLHIYVAIGYNKNNTSALAWQYGKAGLTAVWGLCSFALMWLGIKNKQKTLRIISLTFFSIVLLKLFAFDISGISEGGKIFAFILLGVLLLTVSFMYQKLKKIIIDDKKE